MSKKKSIYYPEWFQGKNKKRRYFEGWYFKHVSKDKQQFLVAIPGISLDEKDNHCFIQIITGKPFMAYYIRYDLSRFSYNDNQFDFTIGDSRFSQSGIDLNIKTDELSLTGSIHYDTFSKIKTNAFIPSIMGFYAYIKNLQCNHGVISLDHALMGEVTANGQRLNFDGGRGYVEKDWGSSFPKQYVWVQSNHFSYGDNLIISIAEVPLLGTSFMGLLSIFTHNGQEYRFASYNGANYTFNQVDSNHFAITLRRKKVRLDVTIAFMGGLRLKSPREGMMAEEITETLEGKAIANLFIDGELAHTATADCVGVDLVNFKG